MFLEKRALRFFSFVCLRLLVLLSGCGECQCSHVYDFSFLRDSSYTLSATVHRTATASPTGPGDSPLPTRWELRGGSMPGNALFLCRHREWQNGERHHHQYKAWRTEMRQSRYRHQIMLSFQNFSEV